LYMIIRASRQRRVISWSWLLISCQGLAGILIAVWAAFAEQMLFSRIDSALTDSPARLHADWSPIVIGAAVLIWLGALTWLVAERFRLQRGLRWPAIRDGVKTHSYRR